MSQQYYYLSEQQEAVGPHLLGDLVKLSTAEVINSTTLVAEAGAEEWISLESLFTANGLSVPTTPVPPKKPTPPLEAIASPDAEPTAKEQAAPIEDVSTKKFVDLKLWNKAELATLIGAPTAALLYTSHPVLSALSIVALPMLVLHLLVFVRCWNSIPKPYRKLNDMVAIYLWFLPMFISLLGVPWLCVVGYIFFIFSLLKLVQSVNSWEGKDGSNSAAKDSKHATILAAILAAGFIGSFLFGMLPQNLSAALQAGAYVASCIVGYSLFKSLVWRVNALRGTPITEASLLANKLVGLGLIDPSSSKASAKLSVIKWASVLLTGCVVLLASPNSIGGESNSLSFFEPEKTPEELKAEYLAAKEHVAECQKQLSQAREGFDTAEMTLRLQRKFDRRDGRPERGPSEMFIKHQNLLSTAKEELEIAQLKFKAAKDRYTKTL